MLKSIKNIVYYRFKKLHMYRGDLYMIDMTNGDCNKSILKFALPMIIGNIFQ